MTSPGPPRLPPRPGLPGPSIGMPMPGRHTMPPVPGLGIGGLVVRGIPLSLPIGLGGLGADGPLVIRGAIRGLLLGHSCP